MQTGDGPGPEPKPKAIRSFCGHIPISDHDREHGFQYIAPIGAVQSTFLMGVPLAHVTVEPETIKATCTHYDIRFAYEGRAYAMTDGDDDLFTPEHLIHFSCTSCAGDHPCECLLHEYPHRKWDTEIRVWKSQNRSAEFHRPETMHVLWKLETGTIEPAPHKHKPLDEAWSREFYGVTHAIDWTLEGLTQEWQDVLDARASQNEYLEFDARQLRRGERGPQNKFTHVGNEKWEREYDWHIPHTYETTEMNGTHCHFYSVPVDQAHFAEASQLAQQTLDFSVNWPGWRVFHVGEGSDGFRVELYGGRSKWSCRCHTIQCAAMRLKRLID